MKILCTVVFKIKATNYRKQRSQKTFWSISTTKMVCKWRRKRTKKVREDKQLLHTDTAKWSNPEAEMKNRP